jgi:hypothetical protein
MLFVMCVEDLIDNGVSYGFIKLFPLEINVRFQVLNAANMRMAVFWVVTPCSLIKFYRRFRDTCCLHQLGDEVDDTDCKHL